MKQNERGGDPAAPLKKEKRSNPMKKRTNTGLPKVGSVADLKRQLAFENRTIPPMKAIAEGVVFAVVFTAFILACAVM